MNAFQITFVIAIALIASACADYSVAAPQASQDYAAPANQDYGKAQETVPYAAAKEQDSIITSSVTYPQNKSRVLIYTPAAMVIKRKPTKLILNHPTTYVQPAPLIVHTPPANYAKKVYVQNYPQSVKVTPLYVNVVKPTETKYYINSNKPAYQAPAYEPPTEYSAPASYDGPSYSAPADYSVPSYPAAAEYGQAGPADYSVPAFPAAADYSQSGPVDFSSYSQAAPADFSTYSQNAPADFSSFSQSAPADFSSYSQTAPADFSSYSPAAPAYNTPVDSNNAPSYAFATQEGAGANAGYQLVRDNSAAANALINLGSLKYNAEQQQAQAY